MERGHFRASIGAAQGLSCLLAGQGSGTVGRRRAESRILSWQPLSQKCRRQKLTIIPVGFHSQHHALSKAPCRGSRVSPAPSNKLFKSPLQGNCVPIRAVYSPRGCGRWPRFKWGVETQSPQSWVYDSTPCLKFRSLSCHLWSQPWAYWT